MITWLKQINKANPKTKWFAFQRAFYMALLVLLTIYCYARIDSVRSGNRQHMESNVSK